MPRILFAVLGLGLVVGAAGAGPSIHALREVPASSIQPVSGARVARPALPPDTLRRTIQAGRTLIVALPPQLRDRPVSAYELLRAPALSGIVDRSFAWITRPSDTGQHEILIRAARSDTPPDTLVLSVRVQ